MCEAVWRQLRSPFVLTASCRGLHQCRWQVFDVGLAGCLSCGAIHRCAPGVCSELVQTEDAQVCVITGLCVHSHNLVANEFDDTVMLRQKPAGESRLQHLNMQEVDRHIDTLLTSAQSRTAHELELAKLADKFAASVCQLGAAHGCVFAAVEAAMRKTAASRILKRDFGLGERQAMAAAVGPHVKFVLASCLQRHPHMLRGLDTRTLVFGLLYLMRTGISAHSVCLLPIEKSLILLLPNESYLAKVFSFKAKFITEVENRLKFLLRSCTSADIEKMGFRDVDMHAGRERTAPGARSREPGCVPV